jgi:hypothetical protein
MANCLDQIWRSRWNVDLEKCTATHVDGWVFSFPNHADDFDPMDGHCIGYPTPLTQDHTASAARIAHEAIQIYTDARNKQHSVRENRTME